MAWEDRNGHLYYYRKRREGKRVVSEYVGNGLVSVMAEWMDIEERHEANMKRGAFHEQKESAQEIDRQVRQIEAYTRAYTRACLLLAGYHAPKRQWRKRRDDRRGN